MLISSRIIFQIQRIQRNFINSKCDIKYSLWYTLLQIGVQYRFHRWNKAASTLTDFNPHLTRDDNPLIKSCGQVNKLFVNFPKFRKIEMIFLKIMKKFSLLKYCRRYNTYGTFTRLKKWTIYQCFVRT